MRREVSLAIQIPTLSVAMWESATSCLIMSLHVPKQLYCHNRLLVVQQLFSLDLYLLSLSPRLERLEDRLSHALVATGSHGHVGSYGVVVLRLLLRTLIVVRSSRVYPAQ